MVSDDPARSIAVRVADCMPILLAAPTAASWRRCTRAGAAWSRASSRRCCGRCASPADGMAAIGPCIGFDSFEVGPEVLDDFAQGVRPRGAGPPADDGKGHVDLRSLRRQLAAAGVRRRGSTRPTAARSATAEFFHRRDRGSPAGWRRSSRRGRRDRVTIRFILNRWPAISLLVVVTAATFAHVVANDFVSWDDRETIAQNERLNPPSLHSIAHYSRSTAGGLYIPVAYLVFGAGDDGRAEPAAVPRRQRRAARRGGAARVRDRAAAHAQRCGRVRRRTRVRGSPRAGRIRGVGIGCEGLAGGRVLARGDRSIPALFREAAKRRRPLRGGVLLLVLAVLLETLRSRRRGSSRRCSRG